MWIPVDDATSSEMYVSSKPVKLSNVNVETNVYSKLRVRKGENYYGGTISSVSRVWHYRCGRSEYDIPVLLAV